jgi:tRNA-dihydrouridine synthase
MKPKPLDLEGIEEEVIEEFKEKEKRERKRFDEMTNKEQWDYIAEAIKKHRNNYPKSMDEYKRRLLILFKNKLKQRIKKACEFYLRYKNNPSLLFNNVFQFDDLKELRDNRKLAEWSETQLLLRQKMSKIDLDKYNEWLFKLAFKIKERDEK